jgi:hypothetical protein
MHDHHDAPGRGHNVAPARPAQWQIPHAPHGPTAPAGEQPEPDLDLVEATFAEGFALTSDPTSFLRLAGVPFAGHDALGRRLCLLRVELDQVTDVGAVTPHLGGGSFRYDPLPARLVSRRRRLRFVYNDGAQLAPLSFAEARALVPA